VREVRDMGFDPEATDVLQIRHDSQTETSIAGSLFLDYSDTDVSMLAGVFADVATRKLEEFKDKIKCDSLTNAHLAQLACEMVLKLAPFVAAKWKGLEMTIDVTGTFVTGLETESCNEMTIDVTGTFVTGFEQQVYGTIFASKRSNDPLYLFCENVELFIKALKLFHRQSYDRKDANKLISPAIFDPNHPKAKRLKKRGLNNIVMTCNLWLDFENGQLLPQQIAELFPLTKLLIFNSYNHRRESPRFRLVFPFDQLLTPEAYVILYDNIVAKIEDAGYSVGPGKTGKPSSGLDISQRTPASLFYLPCQAKNPADSFSSIATTMRTESCWSQNYGLNTALCHSRRGSRANDLDRFQWPPSTKQRLMKQRNFGGNPKITPEKAT
jgi:hypothetical protein